MEEELAVDCIMVREGCSVSMVQGRNLDEHETSCRFRKVPCICCQISLPLDSLLEHIKNAHDGEEETWHEHDFVGGSYVNVNGYDQWDPTWFSHFGVIFYSMIRKEGEIWYFWISAECGQEEADRFTVEIVIANRKGDIKTEYTCHPVTVDHTMEQMKIEGNCLVMTTGQVRRMAARNGDEVEDLLNMMYYVEVEDSTVVDC
eukprot:GFUD01020374.1.p1 GENE.GFUD01020374.1~~GFUD01020374.1.p1  ORF type:complete len:202 (-),score=57.16 GFUD01020374.1:60-665(-)